MIKKNTFIFSLFALLMFNLALAQNSNSENLKRTTTGIAYSSVTAVQGNQTYYVQQSIGQASVIGTYSNDQGYTLRQGFIQPYLLEKVIEKDIPIELNVAFYPNPFIQTVNLAFSEKIQGNIQVHVFDIMGRLISNSNHQSTQNLQLDLDLANTGDYFIKVKANNKQFVRHILKGGFQK